MFDVIQKKFQNIFMILNIFNSQLNTSGREPTTCDTPVSHSIDIPSTSLPVTMDCDTRENYLATLFTKGGAVPLLMQIPPISSRAVLVYEREAFSVNDEKKKSLTKA